MYNYKPCLSPIRELIAKPHTIPHLHPECIHNILIHLQDDHQSLYNCLLLNRTWCQSTVSILWSAPFSIIKSHSSSTSTSQSYSLISTYIRLLPPAVKKQIRRWMKVTDIDNKTAFEYQKHLRHLNVEEYIHVFIRWALEYIENMKTMNTGKNVRTYRRPYDKPWQTNMKRIESNTSSIPSVNQFKGLLQTLFINLIYSKNLQSFSLDNTMDNDICAQFMRLYEPMSALKHTPTSTTTIDTTSASHFKPYLQTVKSFLLDISTYKSQLISHFAINCNTMRSLHFNFATYTGHTSQRIRETSSTMDLISSASSLISAQTSLRKLSIRGGIPRTIDMQNAIKKQAHALRSIVFGSVLFENWGVLDEVAACEKLEKLTLENCGEIKDEILQPIVENRFCNLRKLKIVKCAINKDTVEALLKKSGGTIQAIAIDHSLSGGCDYPYIELFATHCSNISKAELSVRHGDCVQILKLCQLCPSLSTLKIVFPTSHLSSIRLPSLCTLHISHSPPFSASSLREFFKRSLPPLKEIALINVKEFNDEHLLVILECFGGVRRRGRRKGKTIGGGRAGNLSVRTHESKPKHTLKKLRISTSDCILDKWIDRAEAVIDECDIKAQRAIRVGRVIEKGEEEEPGGDTEVGWVVNCLGGNAIWEGPC
ncbi:4723_t:CDS:2 [Paraglomus brasilianum]|uniref:4723_t:CDS:1 n=1 Tax=Paraglomus brasilianum TaxID=144538 RepID=A0A9N8Z971_9GLOM|nr:4723_t:CDS:2 [Paraglomus brasilianum]